MPFPSERLTVFSESSGAFEASAGLVFADEPDDFVDAGAHGDTDDGGTGRLSDFTHFEAAGFSDLGEGSFDPSFRPIADVGDRLFQVAEQRRRVSVEVLGHAGFIIGLGGIHQVEDCWGY